MIHESKKYHTENVVGSPSYKTHMKLIINDINKMIMGLTSALRRILEERQMGLFDSTWARAHQDWLLPQWRNVLFSDESRFGLVTSSPPTTTPKPASTSTGPGLTRSRDTLATLTGEINNTNNGNPSSLTIHHLADKGSKYQSNLNEIDKSEQKSSSETDLKSGIFSNSSPHYKQALRENSMSELDLGYGIQGQMKITLMFQRKSKVHLTLIF
nr:unnamed protein product [Callosobruchus chinensis]